MATASRPFRGPDSISAEALTRDAVVRFLRSRGFTEVVDNRKVAGTAVSQAVTARTPEGQLIKMRVRLCWRREGRNARARSYSAAQLRARLINEDWDDTLRFIQQQDEAEGITHTLIVQRDGPQYVYAALIPREQLWPIWKQQREISAELIKSGKMGRIRKNHAENGASPTIWLQDDRTPDAHAVPDALWKWADVTDLVKLREVEAHDNPVDDTFDDCSIDTAQLGRDEGAKVWQARSGFPRDPKVRAAVIKRAKGACERTGCGVKRDYPGFLDVHHILGVGKSDRVWNCVALCPNCHREAHFAPNQNEINTALSALAAQHREGDGTAE